MDNNSDDYSPGMPERERTIRQRVHRIAEFYQHGMIYLLVIGLLAVVNAVAIYNSTPSSKWQYWGVIWPAFGWGIGVIVHGITVLPVWGFFSHEWEDRKVKELMERERQ